MDKEPLKRMEIPITSIFTASHWMTQSTPLQGTAFLKLLATKTLNWSRFGGQLTRTFPTLESFERICIKSTVDGDIDTAFVKKRPKYLFYVALTRKAI